MAAGSSRRASDPRRDVRIESVRVGEPEPRVAVTGLVVASARGTRDTVEAAATVRNPGSAPARVTLTAHTGGGQGPSETTVIPPDRTRLWRTALDAPSGSLVEVRMGGSHAGGADARRVRAPAACSVTVGLGGAPAPEIQAAIRALERAGSITRGAAPVVLFVGRLPGTLPPRWIYVAPGKGSSTTSAADREVALDLLPSAPEFLLRTSPFLIALSQLPPDALPSGMKPVALAAGLPAVAVMESPRSRGIWWGVPLEKSAASRSTVVPLALDAMLRWLDEAGDVPGPTIPAALDADVRPVRSLGARPAAEAISYRAQGPVPVRGLVSWIVLGLVFLEGGRRAFAWRRSEASLQRRPRVFVETALGTAVGAAVGTELGTAVGTAVGTAAGAASEAADKTTGEAAFRPGSAAERAS